MEGERREREGRREERRERERDGEEGERRGEERRGEERRGGGGRVDTSLINTRSHFLVSPSCAVLIKRPAIAMENVSHCAACNHSI